MHCLPRSLNVAQRRTRSVHPYCASLYTGGSPEHASRADTLFLACCCGTLTEPLFAPHLHHLNEVLVFLAISWRCRVGVFPVPACAFLFEMFVPSLVFVAKCFLSAVVFPALDKCSLSQVGARSILCMHIWCTVDESKQYACAKQGK